MIICTVVILNYIRHNQAVITYKLTNLITALCKVCIALLGLNCKKYTTKRIINYKIVQNIKAKYVYIVLYIALLCV